MTAPSPHDPAPSHGDSLLFSQELDDLKQQLQEQLTLLRDERLDELLDRMRDTTRRLQTLPSGTAADAAFAAELAEIRSLHNALELSIADRLTDTRDRLNRLHKGRRVLRAYRG